MNSTLPLRQTEMGASGRLRFHAKIHTLQMTELRNPCIIPRTCNLWNVLSSSSFPESYNLPSFKSKTNKPDFIPFSYFIRSSFVGVCIVRHGLPMLMLFKRDFLIQLKGTLGAYLDTSLTGSGLYWHFPDFDYKGLRQDI